MATEKKPLRYPTATYFVARVALLAAIGALVYALGMRGIPLIIVAFLASGLLSYIVLNRARGEMGSKVGGYFSRMNARIDSGSNAEDGHFDASSPEYRTDQPAEIDLSSDVEASSAKSDTER